MAVWIVLALALATPLLVSGRLRVDRYSGRYLGAHLSLFRRGVYFSRTADGSSLKLMLRERRACGWLGDASDPPPDFGVREPRRPPNRGPHAGTAEVAPPDA